MLVFLSLSGSMQSRRKRGGKWWGLSIFCSSNRLWPCRGVRTLPKFGLGPLWLFTSVPRHIIFMVCFKFQSYPGLLNFGFNCSEFYPIKFWISARLRFHSPTWQPGPMFSKPSLWDFFFLMLCFPLPLHLALNFLVSPGCCTLSFYYTLHKVWIWLPYINTLGSLRQQADPWYSFSILNKPCFLLLCNSPDS